MYQNACALKRVCYNAETTSNKLSRKGLSVIRNRLFRAVKLVCFATAVAAFALPAQVAAAVPEVSFFGENRDNGDNSAQEAHRQEDDVQHQEEDNLRVQHRQGPPGEGRSCQGGGTGQGAGGSTGTRFKTDANGDEVPDVRAEAAIIYNPENGAIL